MIKYFNIQAIKNFKVINTATITREDLTNVKFIKSLLKMFDTNEKMQEEIKFKNT